MYKEKDFLFKYELKDAFEIPIKSIAIVESNSNIILSSNIDVIISHQIKIDKIKTIINKYSKKLDSINDKKIPNLPMLDGYINTIYFKDNNKAYDYKINNLGFYSEDDINNNDFLSLLFNLLDEIYEELQKQEPKIEEYFVLDDEENEEE